MNNKTVANAGWLIGCKVIQSLLGFVVSMLTARYLGPGNYGIINYAMSLVAFVAPLMTMGLNSILVQEIVTKPEQEGKTLGTALTLAITSSFCCMAGVVAFAYLTGPDEPVTIIVCSLYSLTLLAQALELVQYWFQAKLLSKYTAVVSLVAYGVISAYKIFLLATQKSIYWFAVSNALDFAMIGVALLVIYRRIGTQKLSFSWSRAREMFAVSKYYVLSNLMITVFAQMGSILLKQLIDETATGLYTAAVSCAGLTNFVFTAVIDSARPSVIAAKKTGQDAFEYNVKRLYSLVIYLSLAQSVVFTLLADVIVHIIYGAAYAVTADVLRVLIWYTTFSYIGSVRGIWILVEGHQKYLWLINMSGALCNVALNVLLITKMGAVGAALATLATQIFTNIITGYILKPLRRNNRLILESLNPKYLLDMVRMVLKR